MQLSLLIFIALIFYTPQLYSFVVAQDYSSPIAKRAVLIRKVNNVHDNSKEETIEIKWIKHDNDENISIRNSDASRMIETKVIKVKEVPGVFAPDASIDIIDFEGIVIQSEKLNKYHSRQLLSKSSHHDNDEQKDWAVFNERNGEIVGGVFTHNGGKQMYQVHTIDDVVEMQQHKGRILVENVEAKHEMKLITSLYLQNLLGLKDLSKRILDDTSNTTESHDVKQGKRSENEIKEPNIGCGTDTESKDSHQRIPKAQRKGNSGVEKDEYGNDAVPREIKYFNNINVVSGEPTPFFPGCYDTEALMRQFMVGIALDAGYYKTLGSSMDKVASEITAIVGNTRLIYLKQFNILPTVGKITIGTARSRFPLSMSSVDSDCPTDMSHTLTELGKWNAATNDGHSGSEMGHWMLLTTCWKAPGVVGIANIGSLCDDQRNVGITARIADDETWLIYAHELGHGFGAQHTFGLGGLMDYDRPYYNNVIQFHPDNRPQMCQEISFRVSTCKYFVVITQDKQCGNGVIEADEECECIGNGKLSCGPCVSCKLKKPKIACSTDEFVMRTTQNDRAKQFLSATRENLSNQECCSSKGVLYSPTRTCNYGKDVCVEGKCVGFCSKFALSSCKMINQGCNQPCKVSPGNMCNSELRTASTLAYISHIPDGVKCGKRGKSGTCSSGVCVPNDSI